MKRWGLQAMAWLAAMVVSGLAVAAEERFDGVVTRITDGDTVWVRPDVTEGHGRRKPVKLRLVGLDAPERCQPHGSAAGAALAARVQDRRVTVRRRATDMHGRALGTLWLGDQDVGAWLVAEGHAWSARYGDNPGPYAGQERRARAAGLGLFSVPDPELPRDFRRRHGPCD